MRFSAKDNNVLLAEDPKDSANPDALDPSKLKVAQILSSILKSHHFAPNEWMVLGTTDNELSDLSIKPVASQRSEKSVCRCSVSSALNNVMAPDKFLPSKLAEPSVTQPPDERMDDLTDEPNL